MATSKAQVMVQMSTIKGPRQDHPARQRVDIFHHESDILLASFEVDGNDWLKMTTGSVTLVDGEVDATLGTALDARPSAS